MRTKTGMIAALATFAAAAAGAQEPSRASDDEAAIRQVVSDYIGTREDDDAESLAALLTEDVDQQTTSGELRSGREAVVAGSLGTTRRTGGDRQIGIDSIRFLHPDVAIVDGPYDIVGRRDGTDRHYRTTIVLTRDSGAWRIAAIRNMLPTE
ncbi:MAG: SgcJ/EcaC family oxidoreductase [Gammaproteobacteria bacterium]|nr:SgcJ/EcaC family oxidoreductase [Gammaproteobacteria bacterium]